MTIKELNERLIDANEIIFGWKRSNDDIDDLYLAVNQALEANREAIIEFLTEFTKEK